MEDRSATYLLGSFRASKDDAILARDWETTPVVILSRTSMKMLAKPVDLNQFMTEGNNLMQASSDNHFLGSV